MAVSAAEIAKNLRGLGFPATRDEIVSHDREMGASGEVMDMLQGLDEMEYGSPVEVEKSFGREKRM